MMTWAAAAAGQWHFEYYFPKIIDWVLAPQTERSVQISGIVFRNNHLDFFNQGPGAHTNFLFKSYENTVLLYPKWYVFYLLYTYTQIRIRSGSQSGSYRQLSGQIRNSGSGTVTGC